MARPEQRMPETRMRASRAMHERSPDGQGSRAAGPVRATESVFRQVASRRPCPTLPHPGANRADRVQRPTDPEKKR